MLRIVDTTWEALSLFEPDGQFSFEKWQRYISAHFKDSAHIFIDDMQETIDTGRFTYEEHFLPVINSVYNHPKLEALKYAFSRVTYGLEEKITEIFGREINADVILYMGLCNGAGCAAEINNKNVVLLGIEMILNLDWTDDVDLIGLIYHELGHLYQKQYGTLNREHKDNRERFIWQLFTEGIAMYFEQMLVGSPDFYHQDKGGWKNWCEAHFEQIKTDFNRDLDTMTPQTQCYFGDWVSYHGFGDVGYYLGARLIQYLTDNGHEFDSMICYGIEQVCRLYDEFIAHKS